MSITRATQHALHEALEPALSAAYERGGVDEVHKFVACLVSSMLREIYNRYGLTFYGRISFSKLASAGIIDEDTAA